MFYVFGQVLAYVWGRLILAKMEAPARQPLPGHSLHAIVLPDILVMIAVKSKVIHNVKNQSK